MATRVRCGGSQVFAVADGALDIAGRFWLPDECGSPEAPASAPIPADPGWLGTALWA